MAECKSCGAKTMWARFRESGKFVMLDPRPVARGNLMLAAGSRQEDGVPRVWVAKAEERKDAPVQLGLDPSGSDDVPVLYRAHFATCSHATEWRKA